MRKQTLLILVVAALAVAGLALYAVGSEPRAQSAVQGPLFAGLDQQLEQVRSVSLAKAGGKTVTLSAGDDGWTVQERDGYPADFGKLRRLLLELASATVREAKTQDPAKYHFLGVQDLEQADAPGVLVRLAGADGKALAELIIGKSAAGDGQYARKLGEARSLLVEGLPRIDVNPDQWLQRDLLGLSDGQVREIALQPASGKPLTIGRDKPEESFRLLAPTDASVADSELALLGKAPAELKLDEVRALSEPLAKADEVVIRTFDGLELHGRLLKRDGEVLSSWQAQAGADQAEAQAKAEALNRRLAKRAFVIPAYQAKRFELQPAAKP